MIYIAAVGPDGQWWVVPAATPTGNDGTVVFVGPDAETRAKEFAEWKNQRLAESK